MTGRRLPCVVAALVLTAGVRPPAVEAQAAVPGPTPAAARLLAAGPASGAPSRVPALLLGDGDVLTVAKWSTLALSTAAAAWGFALNRDADEIFEELEEICDADPARCASRNPDGSFTDPALEDRYQEVVDKDRTARVALIAGQVGVAASVVLFILDLDDDEPPDIPFDPVRLRAGPAGVSARVELPLGGRP